MPVPEPTTARPVDHHYSSGRPFWIVECGVCCLLLNSGHHYYDRGDAERRADEHNTMIHEADRIHRDAPDGYPRPGIDA